MLEIRNFQNCNYADLTKSYMNFFYTKEFSQFLNTTQTGYAHSSRGIKFTVLLKSFFTSLFFCTIQLVFFCFFRSVFRYLYQPRCYFVPLNKRVKPLPNGFLSWILPTLRYSTNFYLSMGLDAYFFVRFITVLLFFFSFVGVLNIIVLIPINLTGSSSNFSASGLDKLSLSNISKDKFKRLNAHFFMTLVTIGLFQWMLIYELQSFIKIRQSFLFSNFHKNSITSKTVLISNIDEEFKDEKKIFQKFDIIPGGVKKVWFLYDFNEINYNVQQIEKTINFLEKELVSYLKKYIKKNNLKDNSSINCYEINNDKNKNKNNLKFEHDYSLESYFYPKIFICSLRIPKLKRYINICLPGFFRFFFLQKKVSKIEWSIIDLKKKNQKINELKLKLNRNELKRHNKLFVEFNSQIGAYIVNQCLLSQNHGSFDYCNVEIHPKDIYWGNLTRNNIIACLLEKYFVTFIFIFIIILYIVPVSFIGLISQIPLLTQLIPFFKWIDNFPEEARETISSFIPSIFLSVLTELVMVTFRFLTYFKGKFLGSELELDLQKWYFIFLFIQQFLVVTILSSITMVIKQLLDHPSSLPILLATNLPNSSSFFYQYIALKAFSFCGSNFLKLDRLILHIIIYKINDKTPRQKFNRLKKLIKLKWGTVYPVYSLYACIGVVYSIISPLVSIFLIFILLLVLLYFKYALRFVYDYINESETHGRFYPNALLHIYAGVYCLECCFIGIFFMIKDENGVYTMKKQGLFMTFVLLLTIFFNLTIYNRFVKYFSFLPILSEHNISENCDRLKDFENTDECLDVNNVKKKKENYNNENVIHDLLRKFLYLHPAFRYTIPKLWLPNDEYGISGNEINYIESRIFKDHVMN